MITGGLGAIAVGVVKQTYRCARLDGCSLDFEEKPERPLTIGELTARDYVGVEIRCAGCGAVHVTNIEGMIARLKAAGRGDEQSKVKDLGRSIQGPCGRCRIVRWEVRILWYDPEGHRVPSWKQQFDKRREAARRNRLDRPGPPPLVVIT
jgi:hypothetical protein